MDDGQKGVLVRTVLPLCDAAKHLLPDDVIMRFDGVQVANDGTVPFRCPRARSSTTLAASCTPWITALTRSGSRALRTVQVSLQVPGLRVRLCLPRPRRHFKGIGQVS
jgi:hypothetical protein